MPNLHVNPGDEELKNRTNEHLSTLNDFTENWLKRIAPVLTSVSENSEVLQAQIQGMQPLLRDYSSEIIHKNSSESNNKSESPDTVKSESEHNDDNIELEIKTLQKLQKYYQIRSKGDLSLSKPQV